MMDDPELLAVIERGTGARPSMPVIFIGCVILCGLLWGLIVWTVWTVLT